MKTNTGAIFILSDNIGITAVPTLGIFETEYSIQNAATTAIIKDDIERLQSLGITHAIASPKGVMMQYIQASTHWEKMWSSGASTLYILEDDMMISEFLAVDGENIRIDPWSSLKERDHLAWEITGLTLRRGVTLSPLMTALLTRFA